MDLIAPWKLNVLAAALVVGAVAVAVGGFALVSYLVG
jgi:hypothetical protein